MATIMSKQNGSFSYSLILVFVAVGVLLKAQTVVAQIPPNVEAKILVKVMKFDQQLKSRAGEGLVMLLLYHQDILESANQAQELTDAFASLGSTNIHGLSLMVRKMQFSSSAVLAGHIDKNGIDAVYVCNGMDGKLSKIVATATAKKVFSFGASERHVVNGAVAGVKLSGGRPKLVINVTAARASGIQFDSRLFGIAETIR